MPSFNMMPPANGQNKFTTNGRTYSCATGATILVPDYDANVMEANGWVKTSRDGAGTTAQRPTNPTVGTQYHDTTVGAIVMWNGKSWLHHNTGASA